ncbi:MAG: hypothetical protein RLZZ373_3216 [Pseudomonadota bacterium]|jgi:hypothetical protein
MAGNKRPTRRKTGKFDCIAAMIRGIPVRQLLGAVEAERFRRTEGRAIAAVLSGTACSEVLAGVECTLMTQVVLFRDAVLRPNAHDIDADSCATALRELTATASPVIATLRERQRATGEVLCIGDEERAALGVLNDVAGLSIEMLPRSMHLLAMNDILQRGCTIAVNGDGE